MSTFSSRSGGSGRVCVSRWLPWIGATCGVACLLGAAWSRAAGPGAGDQGDRSASPAVTDGESVPSQANLRVREGTELINEPGCFRMSGGRVLFVTAEGARRYVGLENLNLERVARAIADSPQTSQWEVTGTITEYRGANFLLVRRAILSNGMRPPGGNLRAGPQRRLP